MVTVQKPASENHKSFNFYWSYINKGFVVSIIIFLSILSICSQVRCEDLVLTGNQQMVIENTTYIQTGNIFIRDNAKLTIRNATLIMNMRYHEEFLVEVSGSGTLEVADSTIDVSIPGENTEWTFLDQSTITITNSNLQKGRVYLIFGRIGGVAPVTAFQGTASISNTQFEDIDLNVTTQGAGSIHVSDAVLNVLTFRFRDGYTGGFSNLKPGYFTSWIYNENGYNLTIERSTIEKIATVCDSACNVTIRNCELSGFASTAPLSTIRMKAIDSIILQASLHGLGGVTASFWGLKPGHYDNFKLSEHSRGESLPDIVLENTEVTWLWRINVFGGSNISVDDSILEYNILEDNSNSRITNSTIGFRLMFYHTKNSVIEFDNTIIENLVLSVPPVLSTMKGNVMFANNARVTTWYGPATIKRNYPVIVGGDFGDNPPTASLSLYDKTGALVWSGQTDANGKSSFDIEFNDNNHDDNWNLAINFQGTTSNQTIKLLTSTPIIYIPSGSINRQYSVETTKDSSQNFPLASLSLFDKNGTQVWSGQTDSQGKVVFNIQLSASNMGDSWKLHLDMNGKTTQKTINIMTPTTINIPFPLIIQAVAVENGVIAPTGTVEVSPGSSRTFKITANAGYYIKDVLVDNVFVGPVSEYTFSNVENNHTVRVWFEVMPIEKIEKTGGVYDDFSASNIDTLKWNVTDQHNVFSLSAGYLNVNTSVNSNHYYLMSKHIFSGDFDIMLPYKDFQVQGVQSGTRGPHINIYINAPGGNWAQILVWGNADNTLFVETGGSSIGVATGNNASISPSGRLRMVRTGTTIRTYYRENENWHLLGNFPNMSGDISWGINIYSGDSGALHVLSDGVYFLPTDLVASIPLSIGWNFISFPTLPTSSTVTAVFADVSSNVRVIWGYDNTTKEWKKYKKGSTDNTLSTIESGKGYWAYMDASSNIDISGWDAQSRTVTLSEGWNLAGYNGTDNKTFDSSYISSSGLIDKWIVIWTWENGQWYAKHATVTEFPALPLSILNQGKAYWIMIKPLQSADWNQ